MVFKTMNKWLSSNLFSLILQCIIKHSPHNVKNINHNSTIILNTSSLKWLGITFDNSLSWKSHIDVITPKLSQACYIVRVVKPFLSWDTLKMIIMLTFILLFSFSFSFISHSIDLVQMWN